MRRFQHDDFGRHRRGLLGTLYSYKVLVPTLVILLVIAGALAAKRGSLTGMPDFSGKMAAREATAGSAQAAEETLSGVDAVLADAQHAADQYDYDKAIEDLRNSEYASDDRVTEQIASYEQIKATLVQQDTSKITHVFFHSLIIDTSKAFDGDSRSAGYNQVMTTKSEFEKILQSMYDRGFVLVSLHDCAHEEQGEDGQMHMVKGDIELPPGKQAFVMSQDDLCYYEYMEGDGFATKMVIGDDGRPTCEYKNDDGSISTGDYDLVPILDHFIDKHPDFSYRGAKACLAFTGYNGILGYRTDDDYATNEKWLAAHPDFDINKEREQAKAVAQCLREDGYELASHSWGHRNMGTIDMDAFRTDTDKWEQRVEPLTGETDIILFPFGSDIGDWHPYDTASERFQYLYQAGFRYFCNVDGSQYFVQLGDDYFRQGRRNLDGYRMYYDLPETNPTKDHLSDLFDVSEVFDRSRPTPVPPMSGG
jgi:hypothetical protein